VSNTDSTSSVEKTIRAHLLAYVPADASDTLAVRLGSIPNTAADDGKLYIDWAPDKVPADAEKYPYAVMRLIQARAQGDDGGFSRHAELELHFYHRPRSRAAALKAMADVAEQALRSWAALGDGEIVALNGITRDRVFFEAPADREVVLERLVVPHYYVPTFLTQSSGPLA